MIDYLPFEREVAKIAKELRLRTPRPNGVRKWRERLLKETGWGEGRHYTTIGAWERDAYGQIEIGYVTACALVTGVEVVVGANPRIIERSTEAQARDLMDRLRVFASTGRNPPIGMNEVFAFHKGIDWELLRKVDGAA